MRDSKKKKLCLKKYSKILEFFSNKSYFFSSNSVVHPRFFRSRCSSLAKIARSGVWIPAPVKSRKRRLPTRATRPLEPST